MTFVKQLTPQLAKVSKFIRKAVGGPDCNPSALSKAL